MNTPRSALEISSVKEGFNSFFPHLLQLVSHVRSDALAVVRDENVTLASVIDWDVLREISPSTRENPLIVGDIIERLHLLPAQMSRLLRRLEGKGDSCYQKPLVECSINKEDRRRVNVLLTTAGNKILSEADEALLSKLLDRCSDVEVDRGLLVTILQQSISSVQSLNQLFQGQNPEQISSR